ncbi:receptor-binding cancer antigen expressed on SiSo cells-like isoform X2 [Actinia tenebrosa]|uniref:Receptor-binding cancer antigen expressed on SiSo cells-like isoform X2 n=1 Tax=Actinia tenebrosa TaxID=6105 RepID=A0A6P8HTZ6_ACTTE|nr:receptor-binding cancer antigen expressed on SiSo cells-like isoform X2 [Actinia tenebrosa]
MKTIWLNFSRIISCFSFIFGIIKKIFCRGRRRKDSEPSNPLPVSTGTNDSQQNQIASNQDASWTEWGSDDHFSIKIEPTTPPLSSQPAENEGSMDADDLFKDMTPVFKKPKKIVLKQKSSNSNQYASNSPSRLNFDMSYPPAQTDLGTWEDTNEGWDGDEIDEKEIEWETENVLREKRYAERERRALEQQRKKEEREAQRLAKKSQHQLGIKVNS